MNALVSPPRRYVPVRLPCDPIIGEPSFTRFPLGVTLAEIAEAVPLKSEGLRPLLEARVNGVAVPRADWDSVPSPDREGGLLVVSFHIRLHGGGGGGGRSVGAKIATAVAAIALVGAALVSGGALAGLSPFFAAGATGAKILAAGLTIAGVAASLVAQGLTRPRTIAAANGGDAGDNLGFASATNDFAPGAPMRYGYGTVRIFPQLVEPPYTELDNGVLKADGTYRYDQFVTIVLALPGAWDIDALTIGGVDAEDMEDVQTEIGDSTTPLAMIANDGTRIEDSEPIQLSEWDTNPDDSDSGGSVPLNGTQAECQPTTHLVESKKDVDSFRLEYVLAQGLWKINNDAGEAAAMTLRHEFRYKIPGGWSRWHKLPELVIRAYEPNSPIRLQLRVDWVDSYPSASGSASPWPPTSKSFSKVKGWAVPFISNAWSSNFWVPSGNGYVGWTWESETRIVLSLLTSQFPKGRYQFRVKRSWPFAWANFDTTTKQVSGLTDFYVPVVSGGTNTVPENPRKFHDDLALVSRQSRWNEYPITNTGGTDTVIAIRARNRQIGRVAVTGSPLIENRVNGVWTPGQRTDNPAAWYRHVLMSERNAHAVDEDLIKMSEINEWHRWCENKRKRVGLVTEGRTVTEVLSLLALAGWAVPRRGGALRGAVVEKLVRGGPTGLITQRNASRFSFEKAFQDRPHALRVQFEDEDYDYEIRELTVYDEGYNSDGSGGLREATKFESIAYESIKSETLVLERAAFDLAHSKYRSRFVSCLQDLEYLEHEQGSLVIVETDILGQQSGRGRIVEIVTDGGGDIAALVLDEDRDFTAADAGGATRGAMIRLADGDLLVKEVTGDDSDLSTIVFATPFAMPTDGVDDLIVVGGLVATGTLGQEARPMRVTMVRPGPDRTAELTLHDYAANELYGSAFDSRTSRGFDASFDASFG